MNRWGPIAEIVHQPDFMSEGSGSWEDFRRLVGKRFRERFGDTGGMRGIMDESIAEGMARRGQKREQAVARRRRELDMFFERLKEPIDEMKGK